MGCLNCDGPTFSKYCSNTCQQNWIWKNWLKGWLSGEILETVAWPGRVKRALRELRGNKCEKCGWCEINPVTGNVPVQLEHKDGNHENNRPENVALLCPNCHSLTPTFMALNKGKGRDARRLKQQEGRRTDIHL